MVSPSSNAQKCITKQVNTLGEQLTFELTSPHHEIMVFAALESVHVAEVAVWNVITMCSAPRLLQFLDNEVVGRSPLPEFYFLCFMVLSLLGEPWGCFSVL